MWVDQRGLGAADARAGEGAMGGDHEDQMQLGIRIITSAFQKKMNSLEQEIRGSRLGCEEHRANVAGLQRRNSSLEVELVENHQRAQQLQEENKELFKTVTSLRKQIGRLEQLKQAVLGSIQDDQAQEAELGDSRILMSDEFLRGAMPLTAAEMGYAGQAQQLQQQQQQQQRSLTAAPAPQAHHNMMPPREPQAVREPQPVREPTAMPPPAEPAAAALGAGGSPGVDGKQFFRQARSRLSYEAFNQFLASIKKLNNQQSTREETLDEARRIFGPELGDLYKDFETLLNRHGM